MGIEGLKGIFGFVAMALEEEEQPLLIKELLVVVNFVFSDVLMELVYLFAFVLVVLSLSEVKEPRSFFPFFRFLLFLWIGQGLLLGKKR